MTASLQAHQRAMAAAIADGRPAPGLLRPPARLAVYRHAYLARLGEALQANFPVLHRVLGDEAFAALVQAYVQANPSCHPSIRWFGDQLAPWLRAHGRFAPHPALPDLAAMEWAIRHAFDAADAEALGTTTLAALPPPAWPGLRFQPHPSVTLLPLAWAVEALWQAVTADAEADADPPAPQAHTLLVWRQGLQTHWRTLDADEVPLLTACLAGECFADLCALAAAVGDGDTAAARVAGLLRLWVDAGLLCTADAIGPP